MQKEVITLEDILEFHVKFERIHPFQDGQRTSGTADYVQRMSETQYCTVHH